MIPGLELPLKLLGKSSRAENNQQYQYTFDIFPLD
jgi:hypothetical protein